MDRIEFDSIWWKHSTFFLLSGNHVLLCIVNVLFRSEYISQYCRSRYQRRSLELSSGFSAASLLCRRGTWLIELLVDKMGLRPPLFSGGRHSWGTLWYGLCYRTTTVVADVSAVVAPVGTR